MTLLLFFAMCLVAAYANRGLVFEQRASTNQYRAAQAFEAAEAGIDWAIAHLNQPQRINDQCLPSSDAADTSFRERYLQSQPDTGQLTPVSWTSGTTTIALQPVCVRIASGWACHCPSNGLPSIAGAAPDDGSPHPAFAVQFSAEAQPGVIRITAIGCSSAEGPCRPDAAGRPDASSQLQALIGLLPGLRVAPTATLTAKGSVDVGAASLGVHNPDVASGGLTVRTGGHLIGPALRLSTAPGGVASTSVSAQDAALAAIDAHHLFAAHFGVDPATWNTHTAVQAIDCRTECAAQVAAAIDGVAANRMVSIAGDARLAGPVTLGSASQPVVLVVDGTLTLSGEVTLHGLVYASDIHWEDASGPHARVHGALISATNYRGNGAPDLHYDAAVLRALQRHTGSFARVPGSWRDF
ncbi:MAG: hypothetical protein K2Q07_06385 [Burkholderiaceae bacterium]|nr:hypothetical protein [Burkholderiaceae bacterium]